jgi:hypothetical protein
VHKLSIMRCLVKKQVKNVKQHMSWDTQFSRYMSPSNVVTYFSAVLSKRNIAHCWVYSRCVMHCRGQLPSNDLEYACDKYCDAPLTVSTNNNNWAGIAAQEDMLYYPGRRHPDANVQSLGHTWMQFAQGLYRRQGLNAWPPQSADLIPMDALPVETSEGVHLCSPPRNIEDLMANSCDNMLSLP